jgi:hypothetical protein
MVGAALAVFDAFSLVLAGVMANVAYPVPRHLKWKQVYRACRR